MEFVSDTISYMVLKDHSHDVIPLGAHATTEDKSDGSKDSFYMKLQQVFNHFPKYCTKILPEDFNAKLGKELIFKHTIGNETFYKKG
jgi:hypothetical protein